MFQLNTIFTYARSLTLTAALGASLLLTACGGGGGGGEDDLVDENGQPLAPVTEFTIVSTPELDGVIMGDNAQVEGRPDLKGGVGDFQFLQAVSAGAVRAHTVYSFDLSEIPAGATVVSARLSTFTESTLGDPEAMMALMRIDHVNYATNFPANFGAMQQLDINFATIADINTLGRKDIDVTQQVQADVDASRTRSQYRLRPAVESDFDPVTDMAFLTDGEDTAGTGELPMLIIEIE